MVKEELLNLIQRIINRMPSWNLESFFMLLLIGIAFGVVLYKSRICFEKKIISIVLYIYSANVLVSTLLGRKLWEISEYRRAFFLPFFLRAEDVEAGDTFLIRMLDYIMNIGMFIPIGFLLVLLVTGKNKSRKTIKYCFLASLFLEIIQYFSKLGALELDDIIANTLGAAIGVLIYKKIREHLLKKEEYKNEHTRGN